MRTKILNQKLNIYIYLKIILLIAKFRVRLLKIYGIKE